MPKCEHGLTSKECYVCASPKYAEQAEKQEPVAKIVPCYTPSGKRVALNTEYQHLPIGTDLYTTPQPQREWVGLTDEEANQLWESTDSDWELMKRTEAKLKEKNT